MATDEEIREGLRTGRIRPRSEEARQELVRRGLLDKTSIVDAALRTGSQGITLGFGDELAGNLERFRTLTQDPTGRLGERVYQRRVGEARQRIGEARTDRPVTSFVAETAGSLAPGGAAFGGLRAAGLAARPALYASQTAASAIHGAGSGKTPEQRLVGGGLGAALGLGGTAVGETLGYGASMAMRQGLDPAKRAARLMAREVERSAPTEQDLARRLTDQGMNPATALAEARRRIEAGTEGAFEAQDMVRRATRLQPQGGRVNEMAMEMFPRGRRVARAIRASGGAGSSQVERAVSQRATEIPQRILDQAANAFRLRQTRSPGARGRANQRKAAGQTSIEKQPPLTGFQEFRQRLDVARRGQSQAAYTEAYREALTPEQQALAWERLRGGGFKAQARTSAMERAEEDIVALADRLSHARATGANQRILQELEEDLLDTRAARDALQLIGEARQAPTLNARALDLYQRGLRHLEDVAGGARTEGGRNIANVRRTFADTLESISPRLSAAIKQYRATRSVEEYLDAGRSVFQRRNQGEIDDLLRRQMSTEEQDAFMVGAMEAIEDQIAQGGGAFVMRLMRNQNWMTMLERAAGSKAAARRLRQRIERSALQKETEQFVNQGSQTTPIAQDIRQLGNEDELGFVADFIRSGGDIKQPLLRKAAEAYESWQSPINNPEVSRELARMLTTRATPQRMTDLAQRIQAAPRSPIFLPAARKRAQRYGVAGAALAREPLAFSQ